MALSRHAELLVFFERALPLLRCHYWNPKLGICSCGNPECPTPGKHPKEMRGVYDARVYKSAREIGNSNVALATGHGINVLDIDPRNGGNETLKSLTDEHGPLPATWSVDTGGGGKHYYFAAPEGTPSNKSMSRRGVELQGRGAYVLLPTSFHQSGRAYEWDVGPQDVQLAPLPDWILHMGGGAVHATGEASEGNLHAYGFDDIRSILAYLSPDCDRATWRTIGWALRDAGVPFEVFDEWSSKSAKYKGVKDTGILWKGYKPDGGIHAGSLFSLARREGWEPSEVQSLILPEEEDHPPDIIDPFAEPPEVIVAADAADAATPTQQPSSPPSPPLVEQIVTTPDPVCPDWPPGYLGDLALRIYETAPQRHKEMAIMTALSVVSGLATMNYVTPIRRGCLGTYSILVASAAVGKEHYRSRAESIIERLAPKRAMSEPLSSQALRFQWIDCNARCFNCDEILKWLTQIYDPRNPGGSKIVSDVLKVWGLGSAILKGYATKSMSDITPDVSNPSLTILGCGTEQRFRELCKSSDFVHDGLLSRIDAIFSTHTPDTNHTPLDTIEFRLPVTVAEQLRAIAKTPVEMDMMVVLDGGPKKEMSSRLSYVYDSQQVIEWASDEEPQFWREIFRECKERCAACKGESVEESLWSRCSEKVVRTASLLAIMTDAHNPRITLQHLQWAWDWHQYVVYQMRGVIGVSRGSAAENLRARIIRALEKHRKANPGLSRGATLRDLQRADKAIGGASHREVQDAVSWLSDAGNIAIQGTSRKGTLLYTLLSNE